MSETEPPFLWVFGGPNGAGKTTLFNDVLRGDIPYVNADEIAKELDPASSAIWKQRSSFHIPGHIVPALANS